METADNCTIGQLDTCAGERVRLVALRVGTVITERNDVSKTPMHQVRLYQVEVGKDDLLSAPLPFCCVPGSEDLRLVIVGELPAALEPGNLLRLLAVDPRGEQRQNDLEAAQ